MDIQNIIGKYKKISFEYDRDIKRTYTNLGELYEQDKNAKHLVEAIFINKQSKFGDSPIIVSNDKYINLPQHLTNICIDMLNDTELVKVINAKKLCFTIYKYSGRNGEGYSVEWGEM